MIRWFLLAAALAGALAARQSLRMPAYTDPSVKNEWDRKAADHINDPDFQSFKREYFNAVQAVRTHRNDWMDFGLSTASASLSLFFLCQFLSIRTWRDVAVVSSPNTVERLRHLAAAFWLLQIPAGLVHPILGYSRGDYPWFADSVFIPIAGQALVAIVGLPLVLGFVALVARRGQYPARLFSRFPHSSRRPIL